MAIFSADLAGTPDVPVAASERASWVPLAALPALLVLAAFAVTFRGFFQYDDFILLSQAQTAWSFRHPLTFFTVSQNGLFTPLNNLLFGLEFRAFGLHPAGYIAFSVLLHLVNTLLVTLLAWRVTRNRTSAAVAGVIFAVGFAKIEAVTWIAAYVHVVTTLFYLLSLNCLLLWLANRRGVWYGLSLLCFVLGMFSKEPIVSLPLMTATASLLFGSGSVRRRLRAAAPFFALGAVYAAGMLLWQKFGPAASFLRTGVYRPGLGELRNLGALGGLLIPNVSSAILHFLARVPRLGPLYQGLSGLCTVGFLPVLLLCFRRGSRAVRFSIVWIVVSFLPFVFVTAGIASRYLYLPSVGFSLLLGSLYQAWLEAKPAPRFLGGRWLLGAYAAANILLSVVWQEQQNQNGRVRQTIIGQVVSRAPWPPGAIVRVQGLPSKFEDIDLALPLWLRGAPRFAAQGKRPLGTGPVYPATFTGEDLRF